MPAPSISAPGGELSDIERYIAGKAPQDLTFDIKQFGYELFLEPPSSFAPVQNVPVGPDYVIGPGDEIRVNVWGGIEGAIMVTVDRDGNITLPKIGTLGVTGLTFDELKQMLHKEFSKSYSDFEMNISMGQLRSMRIYVVGKARKPGAYSISSLSTFVNALFESGGPSKVGTMRDLQLIRQGKTLLHFDLYDFLLRGQKSDDMRLMPEDVVFIPPIGPIVGIAGNVLSPAIYELKGRTRVSELIKMAGGVTAKAYLQRVQVERVFQNKSKIILDLNMKQLKEKNDIVLENGDLVKVLPITPTIINKVVLYGNVLRPGEYEWKRGMRVGDLIKSTQELLPDTLMDTARIDRLVPPDFHHEYRIVNLEKLLLHHDPRENILLEPYDTVTVFNKWQVREMPRVRSEGALHHPGEYDFRPNMKLSDLIQLSGGLKKYAMADVAELTRVTPTPEGPKTQKFQVNPQRAVEGDPLADITLEEDDYLFIRSVPEWDLYKIVTLSGEVRYPGNYTIEKGEKLSTLLARAGGFTDKAYPRGAVFTRQSIKATQQAQVKDMVDRLERELLASGSSVAGTALTPEEAKIMAEENKEKAKFVESLRTLEAKGRMVISLRSPEKLKNTPEDLVLEEGDHLHVPATMESVQVVGAVYNQSAFQHKEGKDSSYYIKMSGGYTRNADKKNQYIVKADGKALRPKGGIFSWSKDSREWRVGYSQLEPGDTIVVPDKLDKVSWLRNIKDITQVLANVASAAGITFVALDRD